MQVMMYTVLVVVRESEPSMGDDLLVCGLWMCFLYL